MVTSGLVLLAGAAVAVQAWQARGDLQSARGALRAAHRAVQDGDTTGALTQLTTARTAARHADDRVTPWLWRAYAQLPVFGKVVKETRGVVTATRVVTVDVLPALVESAPRNARWSGRADLKRLRQLAVPLGTADARLADVRKDLGGLPTSGVGEVDDARAELGSALTDLAVDLRDAAVAARVLPTLLGADRPTRLLVVAQNLAEERATGGLIGSFALLRAQGGRLTLERSGSDLELVDAPAPVVNLGADFAARYGEAQAAATWRSANLTPDVPTAGRILAGLSARQLRAPVDAVVFADPVALSYVLRATGPLDVPGVGRLTADDAVALLLKDLYERYPGTTEQPARKEALRTAFDAVVHRLQGQVGQGLVPQMARAVSSGHLFLYASDPSLERELTRSRLAGALPRTGPFLSVVTQDVGGSKLGIYLHRAVSYVARPAVAAVDLGVGPETVEQGVLTLRLTNAAPRTGLPPYVTVRADSPGLSGTGRLRTWVSVYLGPRSTYTSATLDGSPLALASQVEQGLTVLSTYVDLPPGKTVTLRLDVEQPAAPGSVLVWRPQPRAERDTLDIRRAGASPAYVSSASGD